VTELTLTVGQAANGGSCVARHEGQVVFVRYALPGEVVRAEVISEKDAYLHAVAVEIVEASPHRIESLCPIAGPRGAGCCDLAFAEPDAARVLKGQVVVNQLDRIAGYTPGGELIAERVGAGEATAWRTRARMKAGLNGRVGYHRYHSEDLVAAPNCAQLPPRMMDGVADRDFPPRADVHVVVDDEGQRHVISAGPWEGRGPRGRGFPRPNLRVVEGTRESVQRVGDRTWHVPVTGFWQSHRDAARTYSDLIASRADLQRGMTAWDLYGGAGLFAAALADGVGDMGQVLSIDMARSASSTAKRALADLPQVQVINGSVRKVLAGLRERPDVAVLDPPRSGAGKEVIKQVADAGTPRVIHIGCEVASFARDVGSYREHGYEVDELRVFDAFPMTHHVECVAVLNQTRM
jgi:tRNA/tmRNA/rRNA uracil-C5-methylase (TrmA/RlmC/RlmD family)